MSGSGTGGEGGGDNNVQALIEQIAQLRDQVQNLQTGVQQQPQQPGVAAAFAYSPAQLQTGNTFINYGTKIGNSIFEAATAPLSKEPFDGEASELASFKADIMARATISGWDSSGSDVMNIPVGDENVKRHIVKEYPLIENENIKSWAKAKFIGKENRMSQNNFNMFTALEKSLSSKFKSEEILFKEDEYTVDGTKVAALYFLVIVQKIEITHNASVSVLRTELQNLDKIFKECNDDVKKFNSQVNTKVKKLQSYGETVGDMIHNLFKAYGCAKDAEFKRDLGDMRRDYLMGKEKDLTAEKLMVYTEALYGLMKDEGSWGTHVDQEEQIMALTTEIRALKSKATSSKGKSQRKFKNKSKSETSEEEKGSNSQQKPYPEWKIVPPGTGQPKQKKVNDRQYYWCTHHRDGKGLWCAHKPEVHEKEDNLKTSTPKANVEAAMAAFLDEDSCSSDSSE